MCIPFAAFSPENNKRNVYKALRFLPQLASQCLKGRSFDL